MRVKPIIRNGGEAALALLRLTHAAADVFPPLKGAAGVALHISDMVTKFNSNKQDWAKFGQYVQDSLAFVIQYIPDIDTPRDDLKQNMRLLELALAQILNEIKVLQDKSFAKRALSFIKEPDKIVSMRKVLDDAVGLFQLSSMITTGLDVAEILEGMDMEQQLKRITNKLSDRISYKIDLTALPYAENASWNPSRVCIEFTRTALLEDIWDWINRVDVTKTAEIFWLTGVAGAGKSAVAHTVAKRCYDQGILASSFFFDRETAGRNGPQKLFSTIACDLANLNEDLRKQIGLAIERDQSLATAVPSRQFKELILVLSRWFPVDRPLVIVIDALDEGYDADLLQILRDEVPKLPDNCRILVTSRIDKAIVMFLSKQAHVQPRMIDIHSQTNLEDIAMYVRHKLIEVAKWGEMDSDWPGENLSNELTRRAEGLFIWVATVCDYLCLVIDPTEQLKLLVSNRSPTSLPAEAKMDKLYLTILKSCNWDDEALVKGYHMLMGAIMAAKTPLSTSALQSLHRTDLCVPVGKILRPLSSLVTGLADQTQPVRILHLSLREFLTVRAQLSPDCMNFYLDEIEHSRRLALLCLVVLSNDLKLGIHGTGNIDVATSNLREIPTTDDSHISEELWYACNFWIDHIIVVETPMLGLVDVLRSFLSTQAVLWVEVMTSRGRFRKLLEVRRWLQRTFPEDYDLIHTAFSPDLAVIFDNLSTCLAFGRREEALQAVEEAVELRQWLAADDPNTFNPVLATSLKNLASRLTDVGRVEEAFQTAEKSVTLFRQLATDNPAGINPSLAASLSTLANCLYCLGRRKEALHAIKEAVEMYRPLAADNSAVYNPDLAFSLNNLTKCLSALDRREDSLRAVEEAVTIYRLLVVNRPAIFKQNLAYSLGNLAKCLSRLGRRQEALQVQKEAVEMYRLLAADHPAKFNPNLAYSLNNFADGLMHLGRQEDAFQLVKEAVEMFKTLAEEHPTTFNSNLAYSFNNLAKCLSYMGRREDALRAMEQAIQLRRQLAADRPSTFNPDLAFSLDNFSGLLFDYGRLEEALQAVEEAVQLRQRLVADNPAAINPVLSASLGHLANCLFCLGRREEALQTMEEAIELRRQLALDSPTRFNPHLAESLRTFATWMADLGHQEGSQKATLEAGTLIRCQGDLASAAYDHMTPHKNV